MACALLLCYNRCCPANIVTNTSGFQESDGSVEIRCDNMDLCGDIVQALAVDYLGLEYLNSFCEFPRELSQLETLLSTADEQQSVRQRLSADMADHSGLIRSLIVRAEDSRLMMDM